MLNGSRCLCSLINHSFASLHTVQVWNLVFMVALSNALVDHWWKCFVAVFNHKIFIPQLSPQHKNLAPKKLLTLW